MNITSSEMIAYSKRPNSKSVAPAQSRAHGAYGQATKQTFEVELQKEMHNLMMRQGAERQRHKKIMAENKKRLKAQQEMLKKDLDHKKQEEEEVLNKYKENRKTAYVKYLKETSKELMQNLKKEENLHHHNKDRDNHHLDSSATQKNISSSIDFLPVRNPKQRLIGALQNVQMGKSVSPSQKQFEQIAEVDESAYYSKNFVSDHDPNNNYQDIINQYYMDLDRVKHDKDFQIEKQKVLTSLNKLSGNTSTRNNNLADGNGETPTFMGLNKKKNVANSGNSGNENNKTKQIEKKTIKGKVSQAMEDNKKGAAGAYVDSFNFDEELHRLETGFEERQNAQTTIKVPQKFVDAHPGKPVEDPYLKFLDFQARKQGKPHNVRTSQKLSGSVDSQPPRANLQNTQSMGEENDQLKKWTPPARQRSVEVNYENQNQLQYQNINVNNDFVRSLYGQEDEKPSVQHHRQHQKTESLGDKEDYVKEDYKPYKTFKMPSNLLPSIKKEEVVFAHHQIQKAEEPSRGKSPFTTANDKRSLIIKQQAVGGGAAGLNSSRTNQEKSSLQYKPPSQPKGIKKDSRNQQRPVVDEQSLQENYRKLNEEEALLQNEIVDLHLKEMAKVRHVEQKHQLNGKSMFPNFPIPDNVVKEEELEESLDRLDTTNAKPKNHFNAAYSQVTSSYNFSSQNRVRESPSMGLPIISSHPQKLSPHLMQVSSHNITNQYQNAFHPFPPPYSTTSYNSQPNKFSQLALNGGFTLDPMSQQGIPSYHSNIDHRASFQNHHAINIIPQRSVNLNDDVSSHASLGMNQSRVSIERYTPNRYGGNQVQPLQQQQWQKAYGNDAQNIQSIRENASQQFGKSSLSLLKDSERLTVDHLQQQNHTNPNDVSMVSRNTEENADLYKSIMKGGGGRSTIRDESVGYGARKQQMKDYKVKKQVAAENKEKLKEVVEKPEPIEKENIEGGMKVVTNTHLIHLLMNGGDSNVDGDGDE